MNAQFKKGVLELIVLAAVEQKDMYGYELVAEVSKVVNVKEGTIYPILKRLTNEHYFETYLRESTEGPPRKYYHLTAAGILHLRELEKEWEEFSQNVNRFLKERLWMLKKEFLKELEDRLQMLNEKERKDMIEEYSQHISMRMESGMKEEEAIDDFGNIDDLIAEILDAYHLDPEYEVKNKGRNGKTGVADLLPKDFFEKRKKKSKERDLKKNKRVETMERFKKNRGETIENIADKARKTSGSAISWSWDKAKKIFLIFVKVVLICLVVPAAFFDVAGLVGLGTLSVMAFQGYPVIGCVIVALGAALSMTAYILFLFSYILKGKGEMHEL